MAVAETTRRAAATATSTTRKAGTTAGTAASKARTSTKGPAKKAAASAKATRAARAGRVETAKEIAADADLGDGLAERAIEAADELHYQVEVNKRKLSVTALTNTLNDRWRNGWRLAHVLEQRGNTVMVFEKRR